MWADVGGARFDFHGISGERASMAKEQVERRGSDEEDERQRADDRSLLPVNLDESNLDVSSRHSLKTA
ncbi:hypothetical protein K0M31_009492 [Melipona bicolor]|uniref:Uncharacterized protein n=1 Tax=Melipona bicolor TaxID=60889 RepID=A0AA40KJ87_9HYME|nr:hypothetical protein K0M31_009492 [Melipona bicolor]